jgi:hypothetical protein
MFFIYICREGENHELKYSIRSLYKNVEDPQVLVVGGRPMWYKGEYLKVSQDKTKHENARNNLVTMCLSSISPENFVLMNDDFFILNPIKDIPYMHAGSLKKKVELYKKNAPHSYYTKILINTYNELRHKGVHNALDYAVHVPMPMNKEKLYNIIIPDTSTRSLYGNIYNVGGTKLQTDVKVYREDQKWAKSYDFENKDRTFVSSNDQSFQHLYNKILKTEFNQKSPLEK